MPKTLKNTKHCLDEYYAMMTEAHDKREAMAQIELLYNGYDLTKRNEQGIEERSVNHLWAYSGMKGAESQIYSIYANTSRLARVDILSGELHERQQVGMALENAFNRTVRQSRRFEQPWREASGELTLHGAARMVFRDNKDWCPVLADLIVPAGSGLLATDLPYAMEKADMNISELKKHLRNNSKGWKKEALQKAIAMLAYNVGRTGSENTDPLYCDALTIERMAQESSTGDYRMSLPVIWVYEVDHSKKNRPVSLKLINLLDEQKMKKADTFLQETEKIKEGEYYDDSCLLYESKEHFKKVEHWYFPFYADCSIGGKKTHNRIRGLGTINYNSDSEIESTLDQIIETAKEHSLLRFEFRDGDVEEKMMQFNQSGGRALLDGMTLAKSPNNNSINSMMLALQLFDRQSSSNTGKGSSNLEGSSNELEIQARQRQSQESKSVQHRINDIYNSKGMLQREMMRRFLFSDASETDDGGREIAYFREQLDEKGIDWERIRERKAGIFVNFDMKPNRVAGDGNRNEEIESVNYLLSTRADRPERQRKKILNYTDSIMLKDSELADELMPIDDEVDTKQILRQQTENLAMEANAALGVASQISDDDIDSVHIAETLNNLQAHIAMNQVRPWDVMDSQAYELKREHLLAHLERLSQSEGGELLKTISDQLSQLDRLEREITSNLERAQQAQQGADSQASEKEAMKQALEIEKLNKIVEDRERKLKLATVKEINRKEEKKKDQELFQKQVEAQAAKVQSS